MNKRRGSKVKSEDKERNRIRLRFRGDNVLRSLTRHTSLERWVRLCIIDEYMEFYTLVRKLYTSR